MKQNSTELDALQNAANQIGLTVHEKMQDDKRKTLKRYFAQRGSETVSPVLDYEHLNYFLLGWIKGVKADQPAKFHFWEDNKKAKHYTLSADELKQRFSEWLSGKELDWINYSDTKRIVLAFFSEGLNSVHDITDTKSFIEMVDLLSPIVLEKEKA